MSTGVSTQGNDRQERPLSPCILICTLDDNKVCLGCGRTLAEISEWSLMTREEQWRLIDDLADRRPTNDVTIPPRKGD